MLACALPEPPPWLLPGPPSQTRVTRSHSAPGASARSSPDARSASNLPAPTLTTSGASRGGAPPPLTVLSAPLPVTVQLPGPTLGPALGSAELQADAPHLGAQCTPHTHNPAVWAAGRTLGSPSRPGRGPDSWFSVVTPCPTGSETLMKGGHAGVPGTDPSPGRGTVLQGGLQLSAEARHARRLLTLGDPYSREGHPGASEEPPLPSGMCRLESRGGNAPTSFHPISPERGSGMHFMRLLRGSPQGSWWPQLETLSSHCLSSLLWLRGHIPE